MKRLFYIVLSLVLIGITIVYVLNLLTTKNFDFDEASEIQISEPIFSSDPIGLVREWKTYSVSKEEARLLLIYLDDVKFIKYPGTICESAMISYEVEMDINDKRVRFSGGCNYFLAEIYNSENKEDTVYADVEIWQFDAIVESILKNKRG